MKEKTYFRKPLWFGLVYSQYISGDLFSRRVGRRRVPSLDRFHRFQGRGRERGKEASAVYFIYAVYGVDSD
jgi:hypothetical protein